MEFTSSYFHAFGNPDFAAVFSGGDGGGGSAQARRPCPSAEDDAARVTKVAASRGSPSARHTPSVFCVPDMEAEEAHHFLDECTLCHKALCGDIFMYRGDTPFCSDECRREQIDMDRAKYRRKKQQHSPTAQQAAAVHRERPQRVLQPQR
ncbi:hypothetical protein PR202_gb09402 [Eleusine coracana subsp. coracana]|uniref:FLZ-type domain-containing protein n=1 Tax=Eleusine coracana subsp. coracana TaxID=191504 RepID=A0AAV5EHW4_ELECO|nr:hypothetical protein QOZ80_2BG0196910 [Eleusine coracana subsp. coracana]GJN21880.1 hypothetical protein PR202_gb09402 [Eleusine coracana subsp. coracana]